MAVKYTIKKGRNKGKTVTLLNPAEKRAKCFDELSAGVGLTNDPKHRQVKRNSKGKQKLLTNAQKAYRAGYIQAGTDSAKCYKANKRKYRK